MDKVTIQLMSPVLGEVYEIQVPVNLEIKWVTHLLIELLIDLSAGRYQPSGTEILCRRDSARVLHEAKNLGEYCVKNGEELVLL